MRPRIGLVSAPWREVWVPVLYCCLLQTGRTVMPGGCGFSSRRDAGRAKSRKKSGPKHILVGAGEKLKRSSLSILLVSMFSLFAATGHASGIKVMCDSPVEPALGKVADLFRQETNNQVTLACNAGPAIKRRIEDGEVADVVVVEPDFVEELTNSGKVRAGDRPMVGYVGIGLGNRVDSPAYDISTIDKFKNTLLGADLIAFNSVKSGAAFAAVLERLGIAEILKPKIVRTSPLGIFDPVLKGKGSDIAAGTMPLIATTPGIKLLGPLPGDLQSFIPFTAALMTNAPQRTTAESFIKFLVSPKAKATFAANGVTSK
ncbi:MAG: molybdate ABC transporter substrate-binding protein [Acetobacteraceae bacterium]